MTQISAAAKALSAGFAVTLLQMVVAIFLVAPDGPFEYRYQTLLQHDSHWFARSSLVVTKPLCRRFPTK